MRPDFSIRPVAINVRYQACALTGFQRYMDELVARFDGALAYVAPGRYLGRAGGHLWEQLILPRLVRGKLLFSPTNTGPLRVKKQVVTIHDVFQLDHPEALTHKFAVWYRFLTPRLAHRAAHVVTISEFSKQRLLTHVPMDERRITVIPNGVDGKFRPFSSDELAEQRSVLGLPSRSYVLCVGSLEPRKNIGRLLQAWAHIRTKIDEGMWLIITGKMGNERILEKTIGLDALPPRVHLTGHVPDEDLPGLYAGATVFAFPSVYEGFGLPPLEAMAAGVPVLTGNQASLPEVVGDAGMMVDPFDVDALADGLLRLLKAPDLRTRLRCKGLERARQFTWEATAEKTWAVLEGEAST